MKAIYLLSLTLCSALAGPSHIPNGWKSCKQRDPEVKKCLNEAATGALRDLMKGVPALGIKPMDPLYVPLLTFSQGDFQLALTNLTVTGLSETVVEEIETDWNTLKIVVTVPGVFSLGNYKLDGKFKLTPVAGKGPVEITAGSILLDFRIKFSENNVEGAVYNYINETTLALSDPDSYHVNFDDLGEDKNKEMNDNWNELWSIMKESYAEGYNAMFAEIARAIFHQVPKSEIAPF